MSLWEVAFASVLLLGLLETTTANWNLFISLAEVKKLLGLPSELYYVREGVVNTYAMQFSVLIPSHINELHFVWQNLRQQPMSYAMGFTVSNTEVLGQPQLNITKRGVVPFKLSVFRIYLPCSGQVTAEVEVNMQMNFSISANNVTTLNFKRKKVCLKDEFPPQNDSVIVDPSDDASTRIFYISVGCVCGLIFLVATVVGFCYVKSTKTCRNETVPDHQGSSTLCSQSHTFMRVETPNHATSSGSKPGYSSFRRVVPGLQVMNGLQSMELGNQLAEITIDRSRLTFKEVLHEGTFGRIYHAVLVDDVGDRRNGQNVYVKTVTDQATQIQISFMVAEGLMMLGLNHRNVQTVLGACLEDKVQPCLVYAFPAHGNLKRFLQKCKFSPEGHAHVISTREVVDFAIQIAEGMQFLHRRKVIHRDLAARNCTLDERLEVKVADNALSRDLFPNDYHCLGDNENRPIKWLALEALMSKQFYLASDVWAFGVTMWELMTLGQQPFIEIDPFEVVAYLKDGYRLSQPINCPDELFTLMGYCWVVNPDLRPTFTQLLSYLQEFNTALNRFI